MNEVLQAACAAQENGVKAALITVVKTSGSTPRKAGAKMLITADGRITGTIGGGCAEAEVRLKALAALADKRPTLYQVNMLNDIAAREGMVCGGIMEVFIQVI